MRFKAGSVRQAAHFRRNALAKLTAMLRTLLLAAAATLAVTAAHAQPAPNMEPDEVPSGRPERGPPPEGAMRHGGLFLSPAGEPFRGPQGERRWFDGADADHDGALTLAELRADHARFFKVLDANHDGEVDGFENGAYEADIVPEITGDALSGGGPGMGMGPGRGRGGPPPGGRMRKIRGGPVALQGAARFSLINEPQPVRGADADWSGRITAAEWSAAAKRRFERMDVDGDGKLTLATLPGVGGRPSIEAVEKAAAKGGKPPPHPLIPANAGTQVKPTGRFG